MAKVIQIVKQIATETLKIDLNAEYGEMLFGDQPPARRGEITLKNLHSVMGIIEMSVSGIIQNKHAREGKAPAMTPHGSQSSGKISFTPADVKPNVEDNDDMSDDDEPMSMASFEE